MAMTQDELNVQLLERLTEMEEDVDRNIEVSMIFTETFSRFLLCTFRDNNITI